MARSPIFGGALGVIARMRARNSELQKLIEGGNLASRRPRADRCDSKANECSSRLET